MVPTQLGVEGEHREDDEDRERDNLLYHFELHEAERTSIALETYPIGGHLKAVFKECDAPREGDYGYHRPFLKPRQLA